jgi:membrane peptidoglycan carboxypeptidase
VLERPVAAALTGVLSRTTAPLPGGRPTAGLAGDNGQRGPANTSSAWMVGCTPQLAVSVWVGTEPGAPSRDGAATAIWRSFLDRALAGAPAGAFPR